jgi:hypothetical protein
MRVAVLGEDRLGVELHALQRRRAGGQRAVAHAHDLAVVGAGADLQLGGQRLALDGQRVVADDAEALGQPAVDAGAVVVDDARLAVHLHLRAHDAPAQCRADGLVPRHTPRIGSLPAKWRIASTQMPASAGEQGPGESTSRAGFRPAMPSSVISSLRNTRTSSPSSPKYCTRL